jgi:hypothetical protein
MIPGPTININTIRNAKGLLGISILLRNGVVIIIIKEIIVHAVPKDLII